MKLFEKIFWFAFLALLNGFNGWCQNDSVLYTKEFKFKDGIYISVRDFRANNPKLTEANFDSLNPDYAYNNGDFIKRKLSRNKYLNYIDSGVVKRLHVDSVFGYCFESQVFYRKKYHIKEIGRICYYFYMPNNNSEILDFKSIEPDKPRPNPLFPEKTPDYVAMFNKWKPVRFKKLPKLIKAYDRELYDEYKKMPASKRKNYLKLLERYNERHPLYFPL